MLITFVKVKSLADKPNPFFSLITWWTIITSYYRSTKTYYIDCSCGSRISRWGCRPVGGANLRRGHFLGGNVCENEIIGSRWGAPPGSATGLVNIRNKYRDSTLCRSNRMQDHGLKNVKLTRYLDHGLKKLISWLCHDLEIPGHFIFFNYIIQILLLVLTFTWWSIRIAILHSHWNTMEGKLFT